MSELNQLVDKEDKHKSTVHISLLTWNISLSSFYFGCTLVCLGALPFQTVADLYSITINHGLAQGILNGVIPVGALIGALLSSILIERFSRRQNILMINLVAFILGILIFIPNFYSLLVFRLGQGICVGIFTTLPPLIIRQLSPLALSGRLGTFVQINITLGILIVYFTTYCLKKITGDLECTSFWFIILVLPLPFILIQSFLLIFVFPYETPKYLLQQGEEQQALALLKVIYKSQYVEQIFEEKKKDIKELQKFNSHQESTLTDTQTAPPKKSNLAFLMAIHIALTQQMSGVNAINIYCGPILSQATSPQLAMLIPVLMPTQKLLTSFATSFLATKFGRKSLLQVGIFFEAVATGLIAIGFILQDEGNSLYQLLIIIGLFLFMGVFGLTLGPMTWVYIAETVQPTYVSYTIACNWIAASSVVILFPIIKQNVLNGDPTLLFAFFTCYLLGSLIINRFFLLETKDKTQQQIREEYLACKVC